MQRNSNYNKKKIIKNIFRNHNDETFRSNSLIKFVDAFDYFADYFSQINYKNMYIYMHKYQGGAKQGGYEKKIEIQYCLVFKS